MTENIIKVASAIVVGTVIIAALQSPNSAGVIGSVTGGFASILRAMTGGAASPPAA